MQRLAGIEDEDVSAIHGPVTAADVSQGIDQWIAIRRGVLSAHCNLRQAENLHAHRADLSLTVEETHECIADGIGTAVLGHRHPLAGPVSHAAVVNKDPRTTRPDHDRSGLHHRANSLDRAAGTGQPDVHGVAPNAFEFVRLRRSTTGRLENPGELLVGLHGREFNLLAVWQHEHVWRQLTSLGKTFDQLAGMRPVPGNSQRDLHRLSRSAH